MAEHLVQLWIRSDDDPSGIDWQAWLPKSVQVEHVQTRSFPWQDVEHEITWWITRRLSLAEWSELDDAESEVLARIVGDDHFMGTAGPIPFEEGDDERAETSAGGGADADDEDEDSGSDDITLQQGVEIDTRSTADRYESALRTIIALVPDYEESKRIADERGAEVANALTAGAWRAAEVARKAIEPECESGQACDE